MSAEQVDSFRWFGRTMRALTQNMAYERHATTPWTPLAKPLSACTVACVTTAGVSRKGDAPFDVEGERREPTWGDPSFRALPNRLGPGEYDVNHLHIDTADIVADINVVLPLDVLHELVAEGRIGRVADEHYSFMGYVPQTRELHERYAPEVAARLRDAGVDLVLLTPV